MRNFIYDIAQLMKKYKSYTFWFLFVVISIGAYMFLPWLVAEKPEINEIIPSAVVEKTQFNADNRITFKGENLNHVIGVFINGVWEPDCNIITSTQEQIELQIPAKYFTEQKDLAIQIETRINSDMTVLSSKAVLKVLSSDTIRKPEITDINPSFLKYNGELIQRIEFAGVNFNEESVVKIDEKAYETEYEDGKLYIMLPFSAWCDVNDVMVQIVQYVNGYPSSVISENYYIDTDRTDIQADTDMMGGEDGISVLTEAGLHNSQIMVQYLKMLAKEQYVTILSVKDEATYCLTDGIQKALFNLGLQEKLFGAFNNSYLAVIDGGNVVFEALDDELIQYEAEIGGLSLHAESAGFYVGNVSSIQIDGVEHSLNQRGMNVVVYDKTTQSVVDSVCFDVFDQVQIKR